MCDDDFGWNNDHEIEIQALIGVEFWEIFTITKTTCTAIFAAHKQRNTNEPP